MSVPRERIIELLKLLKLKTVENGCTPGEAANFAAKAAEWIEKYQIDEAELGRAIINGEKAEYDVEVCQNMLRTGKKVFNPGMTQVVNGLAQGMCCKTILLHKYYDGYIEAVYGVVGDQADADFVCQIATAVVPALRIMAALEGAEHGYEKAGLVRWTNQYLTGAGQEIRKRLEDERRSRSHQREIEAAKSCTALAIITGDSLATIKRKAAEEGFRELYPVVRTTYSRSQYDHTANERGREAGKHVGLNLTLGDG